MRTILLCPFDPVTKAEIIYAKKVIKERKLDVLYLMPWGSGVLSLKDRTQLLRLAVSPYEKMEVAEEIRKKDEIISYEESAMDEERVRHGDFMEAPKEIRTRLLQKGYYFEEVARHMCTPHRFKHSLGVAMTAREIAIANNMDPLQAYNAGLLHDITKAMPYEKAEKWIRTYKPEWLSLSDKIWHSYTAVIWLKKNMGFTDEAILQAIEHHTVGDGNSNLDRVLYIADKIEPGRGYDASKEMKLAKTNLKKAAQMIRESSKRYILEKEGKHV